MKIRGEPVDITQCFWVISYGWGIGKLRAIRSVVQKGQALKRYKNVVKIEQVQGLYNELH